MFHKKTTANLITATFAILLIAQIFGFLIANINSDSASAGPNIEKGVNPLDNLQIKIPGLDTSVKSKNAIGEYISAIYRYAIGSVGILATVVMMYAGMLWITAAGNQEQIGKAKSYITAALTGTVLALTSWMILYQVNPDLTTFKPIKPVAVQPPEKDYSGYKDTWMMEKEKSDEENCSNGTIYNTVADYSFYMKQCEQNCLKTGRTMLSFNPIPNTDYNYCCVCKEKEPECKNATDGKPCTNGYCYSKICLTEKGTADQPCGNEGGKCMKNPPGLFKPCPDGYSQDMGGRDCISNYSCCVK